MRSIQYLERQSVKTTPFIGLIYLLRATDYSGCPNQPEEIQPSKGAPLEGGSPQVSCYPRKKNGYGAQYIFQDSKIIALVHVIPFWLVWSDLIDSAHKTNLKQFNKLLRAYCYNMYTANSVQNQCRLPVRVGPEQKNTNVHCTANISWN